VHSLVDIVSKSGNSYQRRPDREGVIPDGSVSGLREVGDWLKVNGQAVYGTTGSPFRNSRGDGSQKTMQRRTIFIFTSQMA